MVKPKNTPNSKKDLPMEEKKKVVSDKKVKFSNTSIKNTKSKPAPKETEFLMAKTYTASEVEKDLYDLWMRENAFAPKESRTKKSFVVPMPPPNVTGQLHLGHALTKTLQDIMTRYHRMLGDETLYIPGTDHAGIATQVKVEKHLADEGIKKEVLGREKFLEHVWEWKEKYHDIIVNQIQKLGTSCDWNRERFTMDAGLSRAVQQVFTQLYEEGLIYRGEKLVNWCPRCQTVLSDMEVTYEEEEGKLWFIRYFVKAADKSVVVATSRPETMLGDTAVAVHPDDKRYKELMGKVLILPILNREIPIVADTAVDPDFGTGAVKVTPAHSLVDFEIAQRHNLEIISVIGKDGKMSKRAGKFSGLDVNQARQNIVEYLANIGNLENEQNYTHSVGYCSRCKTVVEPYLSNQWFVKMKPLADETLAHLKKQKIHFVPERFEKTFYDWLNNVHDWCISRQLWWGHQIPAYYDKKTNELLAVTADPAEVYKKYGEENVYRDQDVLDTWFSSALWPFSTLGWPLKTDDLKKYYPATVLETGYDIIFFWVVRMVFMGVHFLQEIPFSTVYMHGLVRDEKGQKMSKSLGNGIDPIDVIDQYGADALRLTLAIGNTPGNDLRFSLSKVEGNRNFINKLWNASRFILMNVSKPKIYETLSQNIEKNFAKFSSSNQWVLSRLSDVIEETTHALNHYQFGDAGKILYDFTWNEFCDWFIELSKLQKDEETQDVLQYGILTLVMLWHPYIPFATEKIWSFFGQKTLLIHAPWPTSLKGAQNKNVVSEWEMAFDVIRTLRNMKAEHQIDFQQRLHAVVFAHEHENILKDKKDVIVLLARLSELDIEKSGAVKEDAFSGLIRNIEIYIPSSGLVDREMEQAKIAKEIEKKGSYLRQLQEKLENKHFLVKADKSVIISVKEKVKETEQSIATLQEQYDKLGT